MSSLVANANDEFKSIGRSMLGTVRDVWREAAFEIRVTRSHSLSVVCRQGGMRALYSGAGAGEPRQMSCRLQFRAFEEARAIRANQIRHSGHDKSSSLALGLLNISWYSVSSTVQKAAGHWDVGLQTACFRTSQARLFQDRGVRFGSGNLRWTLRMFVA